MQVFNDTMVLSRIMGWLYIFSPLGPWLSFSFLPKNRWLPCLFYSKSSWPFLPSQQVTVTSAWKFQGKISFFHKFSPASITAGNAGQILKCEDWTKPKTNCQPHSTLSSGHAAQGRSIPPRIPGMCSLTRRLEARATQVSRVSQGA